MGVPDYVITAVDVAVLPPLLLPAVKEHLRIDFNTDDDDLKIKIAAAIRMYEHKTGLLVNPVTAMWNPVLNGTSVAYASPLQPLTVFVALDGDALVVTSEYQVRSAALTSPYYLERVDGAVFPAGTHFELTLGYATLAEIPADMLMSIFRITGSLYEFRQTMDVASPDLMPMLLDDLLVGTWVPRC